MKKILTALSLAIVLIFVGCTPKAATILKGSYQSEREGISYVAVAINFEQDDSSFVEYIDSREVDRGTYKKENNTYKLKSDKQNFEVTLNDENSFEIVIKKLNNGKPIKIKNVSDTPIEITTKYGDEDKYKALLD